MALNKSNSPMPKNLRIAMIAAICLVALVIILFGALMVMTHIGHDNILDNVYVAGVNVGGMTKDQAVAAVNEATANTYTAKVLTVKVGENEHEITPQVSGADLDVNAAVDAAHDFGRSGFLFRRYKEQKILKQDKANIDIIPYLSLNNAAIDEQILSWVDMYNCTVVQTTYEISGSAPADPENSTSSQALKICVGKPGYILDRDTVKQQVMDAYNCNTLSVTAQCEITLPDALDLDAIFSANCSEPKNAILNETTYEITDEVKGYGFLLEDAKAAVSNGEPGETLTFEFQALIPEVTRKTIEDELFKDLLSEYTAKSGSSRSRDTNLRLSCEAINGTILLPGETFDYNSTLGERTPEAGYQLGASYSGMETVMSYGGGICQTSSTLYYCALMADMEIVKRSCHSFVSSYMPFGMDATVSWGGPDFQFRNDSKYPIKIEAYAEGGHVTVKLWGTDYKDYYVKMEYEVLGTYGWKTVEKELPADNAKGYKNGDVITSPYTGYKVQTYRCKYDKTTDQLISREAEAVSVYTTRDKVVCKIIEENKPEEPTAPPTTPTTPTTPPATTEPSQPSESTQAPQHNG